MLNGSMNQVQPFQINIEQQDLDALSRRLAEMRWPSTHAGGWDLGPDDAFIRRLVTYWIDDFDWRAQERRINRFPQFQANVDGHRIHFLYEQSSAAGAQTLLLMHGWPYSFASFLGIIEQLAHPERFGGNPADAFDVVCPSFPGFGFSAKPSSPLACRAIGALMNKLMTAVLDRRSFIAAGSDWGGHTAEWMGHDYPSHVEGVHTSIISLRPEGALRGSGNTNGIDTEAVRRFVSEEKARYTRNFGYAFQQGSRPQALAFGMMDSPVGAAAWMIDKFYSWSDLRNRPFEQVFTLDELLTELMIYQMTGTFDTATWIYAGTARSDDFLRPGQRISVPVAVARFPDPIAPIPPREFVEQTHNIVQWTDFPDGGHFPFYEVPLGYMADIRQFSRLLKGQVVAEVPAASPAFFPGFTPLDVKAGEVSFHGVTGGSGPPLLLLHGYPETHIAWRKIAVELSHRYRLIIPDLPGYGSSRPDSMTPRWTKRRCGAALVALMKRLGHERFALVSHDRGARVGYRLVLDHPGIVKSFTSLAVVPTLDAMAAVDFRFAENNSHWFSLAQKADLPERLLTADPDLYLDREFEFRTTDIRRVVEAPAMTAYRAAFRNPAVRHAMCEDYRSALDEDLILDAGDRVSGRKLDCPVLALWPRSQVKEGQPNPADIWKTWASTVFGAVTDGGHFQPEDQPDQVLDALIAFLSRY
jgi:haloacetate dehalogenase